MGNEIQRKAGWLTIQPRRRRSRWGDRAGRLWVWPASGSRAPPPPGWRPAARSAYRPASATSTHSSRRESAARGRLQPPSNRSAARRHRRLSTITRLTPRSRHFALSPDFASQKTHDNITGYFFIIHARSTMRESLNAHHTEREYTSRFHQLFHVKRQVWVQNYLRNCLSWALVSSWTKNQSNPWILTTRHETVRTRRESSETERRGEGGKTRR